MEKLSKFQDIVISGEMRDVYPYVFAEGVGQSNAFLPCYAVASVGAKGSQGSALPSGVCLPVGVGPIHKSKRAEGL